MAYSKLLSKHTTTFQEEYILNIQEDVKYTAEFLDNLLLYAELGIVAPLKLEVDLNLVLQKTIHNLELEIQDRKVKLNVSSSLPKILGNKISLVQLSQNLIANSIKYCAKLTIISISAHRSNNQVVIAVVDNGIGIKSPENKYMFKAFTRIPNQLNVSGLGLGLALCQTIAKQHNTVIEFKPCKQEGTNTYNNIPAI